MDFKSWLSLAWAEIVAHPDSEQRRRHRAAGTGVDYADVRLPMGVTAGMVADRRTGWRRISAGPRWRLGPPRAAKPGCWTCGSPIRVSSVGGAGRWPPLDDGQVDVFDGVPFGRSQRGQLILAAGSRGDTAA